MCPDTEPVKKLRGFSGPAWELRPCSDRCQVDRCDLVKKYVLILALMSLPLTACTEGSGATSTTGSTAPTTVASPTTEPPPTSTTSQPSATSTSTTLAGEPIEFGPRAGDVLMVIGVRYDDVLNLRSSPGTDAPVLVEIPGTADEVVAAGATRQLPRSLWIQAEYDGTVGWLNLSYVGYAGTVDDRTSFVVSQLGQIPTADTMTALAETVASVFSSEDPPSDVVQITDVSIGDLAEVTYDVVGLGDDSVRGLRLHVFGEAGSGGFGLKSVEVTVICGRGVDSAGLCT